MGDKDKEERKGEEKLNRGIHTLGGELETMLYNREKYSLRPEINAIL